MSKSNGAVAELVGVHLVTSDSEADLWHRVAWGELSPDEAQAEWLAGRAEVGERELERIERAKTVFAPPTDERREEVLEMLLESISDGQEDGVASQPFTSGFSTTEHAAVPLRRRHRRRWIVGLCATAAAVVLTVLLVRPPEAPASFPGTYGLELEFVRDTVRGSEGPVGIPTFSSDGKIGLRLVPEEAIAGSVGAVVFATGQEGSPRMLTVDPIVHPNGVVEIIATTKELGLVEGEWELVVVVGWADALPKFWKHTSDAETTKVVQIVRTRVRVEGR